VTVKRIKKGGTHVPPLPHCHYHLLKVLEKNSMLGCSKTFQMQGPRWFDKLTMTGSRACPELAEGKDEGSMQTPSPRRGCVAITFFVHSVQAKRDTESSIVSKFWMPAFAGMTVLIALSAIATQSRKRGWTFFSSLL